MPPPRSRPHDDASEALEGELARFFGYSNDLLAILDGRGCLLLVSPSAERILGYRMDELAGQRLLPLVHPEDQPRVRRSARELLEGRSVSDLDARVVRADGTVVPMRWSLSVGPSRRIYAVGRDRTDEARRAEAVLGSEMAELRLRTAMELHDGILQTLTGASLQIAVARRLVRQDPGAAEEVLAALGASVSAEQQEMRLYVDEVKGQSPLWPEGSFTLTDRIVGVLDRLRAIWGVTTSLEADVAEDVPAEFGRQVLRVVQEATANSARHGLASSVSVSVRREGSDMAICIADDGQGFPFLGEYDTEALREQRLGPLSLKHRVEGGGGRISIRSARSGSTVSIWLPLRPDPAS